MSDRWDVTEKALQLYRDHPKLPANAVTREMTLVLESRNPDLKFKGAAEQQGLILMYRAMTAGPLFVRRRRVRSNRRDAHETLRDGRK